MYSATQLSFIAGLEREIEGRSIPMYVVDYLDRVDADGKVTTKSSLNRRFGTRDGGHVKIYGLEIISQNSAANRAARVQS